MELSRDKLAILSLQFFSYPDEVGGAWKYTYEVNKRLAGKGHRVFLITCKPSPGFPDYEMIDGIHYYRIGVEESKSVLGLCREVGKRIDAILALSPIDLVHIHNPLVAFVALLNSGFRRIPKVYHFHSLWFDEEKINRLSAAKVEPVGSSRGLAGETPPFWSKAKLWSLLNLIRLVEWACFFSARRILFLSEYSERKFREFFPFKKSGLRVIPGGVDVDVFRPPARGIEEDRRRLQLPLDRPILLTVRRLAARMGLENLVLALSIIVRRSPHLDFLLVIAGHGALEEKLKSLIAELRLQDRVRMVGRLSTETLSLYYRSADLFVLPTALIEGFGLATVEALASGLPALGTPVGGTVEILKSVDERLLFRDTSPEAMADGVESFLKNPGPFLALKTKCRETATARYGWDRVVDPIEAEFYGVAGGHEK